MVIASTGHESTQTPQSMHFSASTSAFSETIAIASLGHSETQDSQPVHFSSSTFAGIYTTLSKKDPKLKNIENGMLQDYDSITTYFFQEIAAVGPTFSDAGRAAGAGLAWPSPAATTGND